MEELWTPWRMRYITSPPPKEGCVFCRLLGGDGATELVLSRGQHSFVVMNLYPYTVGHIMVVPFRHLARCGELTADELSEVVHSAAHTERVLRDRLGAETVHYGINLGRPAGAGVEGHVHLHLVPRGGRIPIHGSDGDLPVPLEETTRVLRDAFASETGAAPSMTRACEVLAVVGARPNFMKVAPILHAAEGVPSLRFTLAHTGQHYDAALSDQFFRELGMREPDVHLKVGSASHAVQTARILERFEEVLLERRPDLVLVAGDVNSTLGCSLAAVKLGIPVAHVEAGLRSGDRTMPEEINRIVTDSVSDLLLTTSRDADDNLEQEGVPSDLIHFVGNTMIDTLRKFEDAARKRKSCESHGAREGEYALVTLHRPSNVDDEAGLVRVLDLLATLSGRSPVLLPLHPRTEASLARHGLAARLDQLGQVKRLPPLGYLDFLSLMVTARLVLTDSGGVQEETTALGVPCFTLRPSTERPVTVTSGTNLLVSDRIEEQTEAIDAFLSGRLELSAKIPELWDGAAGPRIVRVLEHWSESGRPSRVRP